MGYDADNETYTFLDTSTNRYYESAPGNRYGKLTPITTNVSQTSSSRSASVAADSADASKIVTNPFSDDPRNAESRTEDWVNPFSLDPEELARRNAEANKGNREAVRLMLPFVLLVLVSMLLVFKFVNGGSEDGADKSVQVHCEQGHHAVQIKAGETCWGIAQAYGVDLESLLAQGGNEEVDCDRLRIGQGVCVPA